MVNGQLVVRMTLPDGRKLAGALTVTAESLKGELADTATNPCGTQARLLVTAKRVE